jgi:hypothetical protein
MEQDLELELNTNYLIELYTAPHPDDIYYPDIYYMKEVLSL